MRLKTILIGVAGFLILLAITLFLVYEHHLRYTDGFTDCPVSDFRSAATSADGALSFATEESLKSLKFTERCSLDCRHGNDMACALYGVALQKGIFLVQNFDEAGSFFSKTCNRGEALGCDLAKRSEELKEQQEKEQKKAALLQKYESLLARIEREKMETGRMVNSALAFFGGNTGSMTSPAMEKWYGGTMKYLLFDNPSLASMHQIPGSSIEKGNLKDFVLAKYMGGANRADFDMLKAFFDKYMRLGVMQIKLDYRVEKKKESKLKKKHPFFKAKHTFLYLSGSTKLEILETLEKDIRYEIEN